MPGVRNELLLFFITVFQRLDDGTGNKEGNDAKNEQRRATECDGNFYENLYYVVKDGNVFKGDEGITSLVRYDVNESSVFSFRLTIFFR